MDASPEELGQKMGEMGLNGSLVDYDVIKKPRTNFTNNVLRRAIPKMNINDKINSISVNKLNVLSQLRLDPTNGANQQAFGNKKVRTLNELPKVLSLDARVMNDILPPKKARKKSSLNGIDTAKIHQKAELEGIIEGKAGDEDIDDQDESGSSQSDSESGGSSIDMDGEDEDKLYQNILKEQNKADQMKDAKQKGEHLDDLVDKEMIELLSVC